MKKNRDICPFCYTEIRPGDVEFRCSNTAEKMDGSFVCGLEADQKLAVYRGVNTVIPMHRAFPGKSLFPYRFPREAVCPECGAVSRDRLCPHCHNRLPHYYGETQNLSFAVIGAKETGKSHYIAVLIDYIINTLSGSFPFAAQAANDETSLRYKRDFKKSIYEDHVTIRATQSATVDRTVKEPLIYELRFHDAGMKLKKTVTISFFDTAGEDLDAEDTMSVVNRYIYSASGIIMLLDPLQLSGVRNSLPKGTPLPAVNTEIGTIITRAARLIKKAKNLGPREKIDIPLAVSFTKLDVLLQLLDPSSSLRSGGSHYRLGMFDRTDAGNVNDEIEALVNRWAGQGFLSQVSSNFSCFSYFALSALGCNPQDSGQIGQVIPMRVEDPFLWLLWKYKLIRGKES